MGCRTGKSALSPGPARIAIRRVNVIKSAIEADAPRAPNMTLRANLNGDFASARRERLAELLTRPGKSS